MAISPGRLKEKERLSSLSYAWARWTVDAVLPAEAETNGSSRFCSVVRVAVGAKLTTASQAAGTSCPESPSR
jgi:hypothetical protein